MPTAVITRGKRLPAPRCSSMPRLHHVLENIPGGIPAAMFAGDADPRLARRTTFIGSVLVRMDIEKRDLAKAVFQLVGVHVDHESAPIPVAPISSLHHIKREPSCRRTIEKFGHG